MRRSSDSSFVLPSKLLREWLPLAPFALLALLSGIPAGGSKPPPEDGDPGVAIAGVVGPQGAFQEPWEISPEPTLSIGTLTGPEELQLFRVSGAHRLSDGRIGVVNAGTRNVRFFDPHGEHLVSFGRRGGGPEEFEMPVLAGSLGDTLIIVDQAHHRLTLVHPDQGFVGLARISDSVGGFLNPSGAFENGQVVFGGAFDMRRIGELHNGMNRAHTFYRSCNLDGSLAVDFGDKAGAEFFIEDLEGSGPEARPALIPFGRVPLATTSPTHFFFSDQADWVIEVYDPSGQRVRVIRKEWDPVPVRSRDGVRFIQEQVAGVEDPQEAARLRQYLERLPLPEHFPPFQELLADAEGFLWVKDFSPPGEESRAWSVLDPTGNQVGRLRLPVNFRPVQIGSDFILGLAWDEMDVEYIRLYDLRRTGIS